MIRFSFTTKGLKMTDYEFVQSKLKTKLFNVNVLSKMTGISHPVITKIRDGVMVRDYFSKTLADFFRSLGK